MQIKSNNRKKYYKFNGRYESDALILNVIYHYCIVVHNIFFVIITMYAFLI